MRIVLLLFLTALLFPCLARETNASGFVGPGASPPVYRAADVLKAADDAPCSLEGKIVAKVAGRKNRYIFEDASGRIVVEIKRKVFDGVTVTPENLVRIEGEVDVDHKYPNEVKTETLTVLQ